RMARHVPVGGPLPDVADRVVEPVAVGREGPDRRGALETVFDQIAPGEFALPRVGHEFPARKELLAPGERGPIQSASGRELPLGFRWKLLPLPRSVGFGVGVGHADYRIVL